MSVPNSIDVFMHNMYMAKLLSYSLFSTRYTLFCSISLFGYYLLPYLDTYILVFVGLFGKVLRSQIVLDGFISKLKFKLVKSSRYFKNNVLFINKRYASLSSMKDFSSNKLLIFRDDDSIPGSQSTSGLQAHQKGQNIFVIWFSLLYFVNSASMQSPANFLSIIISDNYLSQGLHLYN